LLIINRLPIAFEFLTPLQVCEIFSRALNRVVAYEKGPIDVQIQIPLGYREHLAVLEDTLGAQDAPYFGPEMEKAPTEIVQQLWEGNRSMEEYAREVFPLEESANGLTWMHEGEPEDHGEGIELNFNTLNL
jgi:hypothetical protein